MTIDALVRVVDTVYDRASGKAVAVHTRGAWYEPHDEPFSKQSDRTVIEWAVALPAKQLTYDALKSIPSVHPMAAALGARR